MQSEAPTSAASDGGLRDSGLRPEQIAWGVPSPPRSYWPARAAVVAAIGLSFVLPERLAAGPRWVVPARLTNVIVFALWYWELDRGGPRARHDPQHREPDFLFPQMATPGAGRPAWAPGFTDYFYVSFTNATAFSPTDTMPLTATAKALMTVQSGASLLTVALVAARAVNILS